MQGHQKTNITVQQPHHTQQLFEQKQQQQRSSFVTSAYKPAINPVSYVSQQTVYQGSQAQPLFPYRQQPSNPKGYPPTLPQARAQDHIKFGDRPVQQRVIVLSTAVAAPVQLSLAAHENVGIVSYDFDNFDADGLLNKIYDTCNGGMLDSVAFVDHGSPDDFFLFQGMEVTVWTVANASSGVPDFFQKLSRCIIPGGRIDLLGCNFVNDREGLALLKKLSDLTGNVYTASAADGNLAAVSSDFDDAGQYFNNERLTYWKHHKHRLT